MSSDHKGKCNRKNCICYGDSLMAGYGLPNEQHLSVVLQNSLLIRWL